MTENNFCSLVEGFCRENNFEEALKTIKEMIEHEKSNLKTFATFYSFLRYSKSKKRDLVLEQLFQLAEESDFDQIDIKNYYFNKLSYNQAYNWKKFQKK